jgi:hypothetical protein
LIQGGTTRGAAHGVHDLPATDDGVARRRDARRAPDANNSSMGARIGLWLESTERPVACSASALD